jgi:hypothetical protein
MGGSFRWRPGLERDDLRHGPHWVDPANVSRRSRMEPEDYGLESAACCPPTPALSVPRIE